MRFPISAGVSKTNTNGISKVTIIVLIAVVAIVAAAGAILAMSLTSQSVNSPSTLTTNSSNQSGSSGNGANDSVVGYQVGYTPEGAWTKYLGYIPAGYKIAPREPNAPVFPCPTGMSAAECKVFQQTCGNGVCDPNETCSSCPIDCTTTGSMTCDPYTGRPQAPASVCQVQVAELSGPPG
jgi:hypothetical protein